MSSTILPPPSKSQGDLKEYRHIKLQNGLRVLLISDAHESSAAVTTKEEKEDYLSDMDADENSYSSDESSGSDDEDVEDEDSSAGTQEDSGKKKQVGAAAMCVHVGSFSDPPDIPGLAHFLEHMLFMGSSKFPDENYFDAFLNRHGGSSNATTDCERTVFQFEINPDYFREALNIWAQFFISPLMKTTSAEREVMAIDSEFKVCLMNDQCRGEQLMGSLCKVGHPIGKFLWGNELSLKLNPGTNGTNVYHALRCFHKKYYTADVMTLAIQSLENLDSLQKLVVEIFREIPNKPEATRIVFQPNIPFPHEKLSPFLLYNIVPVNDVQELHLSWFLPPQYKHYKVKPLQYVAWLVGHEGKRSVLSLLKKHCLALSLSADAECGSVSDTSLYSMFSVQVALTERGCEQCLAVMDYIFQYLLMLQKKGPSERIFREIQQIEEIEFAFKEESIPVSNVEEACEHMQLYSPIDLLTGHTLLKKYDVDVIQNVLDALLPCKCLPFLYDQTRKCQSAKGKFEPWFGTKFQVLEIDTPWKKRWSSMDNLKIHPDLDLPTSNPFIAEDFAIVTKKDEADFSDVHLLRTSKIGHKLWFKQDKKFSLPRTYIHMHLINPTACRSAELSAYLDLIVQIMCHNIAEIVYHAEAAGLNYNLSSSPKGGIFIKVSGFSHKLSLLLIKILEYFVNFSTSDEVFEENKLYLRKDYHNTAINPKSLSKDIRLTILEKLKFSIIDKYIVSGKLNKDGLLKFFSQYKSSLHVVSLMQGNYSKEEAIRVFEKCISLLSCPALSESAVPVERIIKLPTQPHFIKVKSLNDCDDNSMVIIYFQLGPGDIRKSVFTQLLGLVMEEPCFDVLRTKKQLGYNVYVQDHNTVGVLGLSINVLTHNDKFSVEAATNEMLNFLTVDFANLLNSMKPEDLTSQIESLVAMKTNDDAHLGEEVERNWDEISCQDCNFQRMQHEIGHLKTISLVDLKKFYQYACLQNKQVLVIQVRGNSGDPSHVRDDDKSQSKFGDVSFQLPAFRLEMLHVDSSVASLKALQITDISNFVRCASYFPASHVLNAH